MGAGWLNCSCNFRPGSVQFLDRLAQLAFRVEHELSGSDDAFAGLQAAQHFVKIIFPARPERDGARFEPSAGQRHEHRVLLAAAQHRNVRHEQGRGLQLRT